MTINKSFVLFIDCFIALKYAAAGEGQTKKQKILKNSARPHNIFLAGKDDKLNFFSWPNVVTSDMFQYILQGRCK